MTARLVGVAACWQPLPALPDTDTDDTSAWLPWHDLDDQERSDVAAWFRGVFTWPPLAVQLTYTDR